MKQLHDYPDVLDVIDIQRILGIGRRQAYELAKSNIFHTVHIGKRIKIPKYTFVKWLQGELDTIHSFK
ncbi:helix-turn-helix domain-containing protein [Aneurinibacillus sp. Ricciae_BoGa-3]|uniref:helix-turn-helix domain-containing protein n=1 Tax=Aneurinibacillus sp. Ricciae_BoGa-3 TaxID=3022697 RepID=UPI00234000A1|nr:helix-turn-helix domain-containing protein [Aneurinibacillus sp. Ricciae_BoGa-3]WCK54745.1 helix-turn-helix domain-containing protein [Aneurinibacillus sp. Ricciae_BoGa-3]